MMVQLEILSEEQIDAAARLTAAAFLDSPIYRYIYRYIGESRKAAAVRRAAASICSSDKISSCTIIL